MAAISCAVPSRPIGWRSMKAWRTAASVWPVFLASVLMRSSSDGDWMVPGQMALARMPFLMKSAATALVRPITAALLVPYT